MTSSDDNMMIDETTDTTPQPSSQELFERMLEEQLRREGALPEKEVDASSQSAETSAKESENSAQITSKDWKERSAAYENLVKVFSSASETDDCFARHEKYLSQCASEKNAAALEKGLQMVLAYITYYKHASRTVEETVPLVIKALSASKSSTAKLAYDILLMYIEIDNAQFIIEQLIHHSLSSNEKNPKIRSSSVAAISIAVHAFGIQVLPLKLIISNMSKILPDTNNTVKKEAIDLTVELYRWMRDSLNPLLESWDLKPVLVKEIQALFEKEQTDALPTAERFLRKLGPSKPNSVSSNSTQASAPAQVEVEAADLFEPQEILSKIPATWYQNMEESKWSSKRDALLELSALLTKTPKLQPGDYSPIVNKVAVVLEHEKNAVVVKHAIEVVEQLSKGLRKDFSYASLLVPFLLLRLKDKKTTDIVLKSLDTIDKYSQSFEEFLEQIAASLDSKTPAVRDGMLKWIEMCLSRKKSGLNANTIKLLGNKAIELSDDANSGIRDAAFQVIARMLWLCGARQMQQFMSKLDKIKTEKVTQFETSYGPGPTLKQSSEPVKPQTKPQIQTTTAPPPKKAPSKPASSTATSNTLPRPQTRAATLPKKAVQKPAAKKAATPQPDFEAEIENNKMSKEEVIEKASEILSAQIISGLGSSNWKERVEASTSLEQSVKSMGASLDQNADVIVRYIGITPGWGEANVQVIVKLLEIVTYILSQSKLSRSAAASVIDGIAEKLATAKAKECGKTCLTAMCETLLPQFTFAQLYKRLQGHKNPKITAEGLAWMAAAVSEFGMKHIKVDQLIDFTKACLSHSNPTVKKNCTELLCEMKKFMGDKLLDFFNDVKPALLASIKKEFDKIPNDPPPAPTRQLKGDDSEDVDMVSNSVDLLPRADIKSKITAKIMKNLEDNAWKNRVAAVTEIEQVIVDANKRIQPTISDTISALKKKLDDSHVQVMSAVLRLLALIATATGPAVEKYCKLILANVISKLSHNNKAVRVLAITTLETWVEAVTLGPMLRYFPKGMSNEKGHPDGRKDALCFIQKHYGTIDAKLKNAELFQPILGLIIESIQDPKPDVRKVAEQILSEIVPITGADVIRRNLRDLKPAFRQTVNGIVDKYAPVDAPIQQPPVEQVATKTIVPPIALSAAMEIENDVEVVAEEPKSVLQSFKQPRTVVRRPVVESVIPAETQQPTIARSQTPKLPERPQVIIAELDESQPVSIQTLIALIQIDPQNAENAINALKKLVTILQSDRRAVLPHVKELVECLTISVQKAFELASNGVVSIRICKYLLNTKLILFSKRNLVELIDKETLQGLVHQLLTRLLDEKLPHLEDGQNILGAFNQLMISILQNSNRTSTYTALLKLLSTSHKDISLKKYTELVVKCLLKLTTALQHTIDKLQIDILLMDLHEFLTTNPPTQFIGKDDLPLRTVKTILNEMVKVKGPSIRTHLSFIPTHKNPLIVSYIELMLNNAQKQKQKDTVPSIAPNTKPDMSSSNSSEMNTLLDEIFECIANKDTCNQGLLRLYKFRKTYTTADINSHLAKCSPSFQGYINRQLIKIEQHELKMSQQQVDMAQVTQPVQIVQPIQPIQPIQKEEEPVPVATANSGRTLSSVDAIRAEVKRRQQEAAKEQGVRITGSVARSLSVQDIRRRFKEVKAGNLQDTTNNAGLSLDQQSVMGTTMMPAIPNVTPVTASADLEALKRRIRAKAKQQQWEEHRQVSQSLDLSLRARLTSTQTREEEKENQPTGDAMTAMTSLKERLARLS